jgi:hypothetical protein
MDEHRNEIVKRHLKAVAETNALLLQGDVKFQDNVNHSSLDNPNF